MREVSDARRKSKAVVEALQVTRHPKRSLIWTRLGGGLHRSFVFLLLLQARTSLKIPTVYKSSPRSSLRYVKIFKARAEVWICLFSPVVDPSRRATKLRGQGLRLGEASLAAFRTHEQSGPAKRSRCRRRNKQPKQRWWGYRRWRQRRGGQRWSRMGGRRQRCTQCEGCRGDRG